MKIKNLQTRFLVHALLLGDSKNFSFEVSSIYIKSIGIDPYRFKRELKNMMKARLIRHMKDLSFHITDLGLKYATHEFPYVRRFCAHWDGLWRILSYEIPEEDRASRDAIRQKITNLGMGPWHRSFWVSAYDLSDVLRGIFQNLPNHLSHQLFESRHIGGQQKELVEKVWQLEALKKKYKKLYTQWHDLLALKLSSEEILLRCFQAYIDVLREDPGLPRQLLDASWEGYRAHKLFGQIYATLLQKK